ncbi:MAG: hypothetical protein ACLFR2_05630 [Candidatus Kapaibacterium sp.]
MAAPQHLIKLIEKHVGELLDIVIREHTGIRLLKCKLKNFNGDHIFVKDEITKEKLKLPLLEDDYYELCYIYNEYVIDLIKAKEPRTLKDKLKNNPGNKEVIARLKPFLEQILTVIYRSQYGVGISKGRFINMGINQLFLMPGPFYNTEESLPYSNILHLFDDSGKDLLVF